MRLTRPIFPVTSAICISLANQPFLFCFQVSVTTPTVGLPKPTTLYVRRLIRTCRCENPSSPSGSVPSSFLPVLPPPPFSGVYIFLSGLHPVGLTTPLARLVRCFPPALLKVWPQSTGKFTFQLIGRHGEHRLTANYPAIIH